jgi:hypothetical protein
MDLRGELAVLLAVFVCECGATLKDNLKHFEIINAADLGHGRMKRDADKRTPVHPAGVPVKELSFKVGPQCFQLIAGKRSCTVVMVRWVRCLLAKVNLDDRMLSQIALQLLTNKVTVFNMEDVNCIMVLALKCFNKR